MRARMPYLSPDASQLMAMLVALGGEVFVMKAEMEALRRALPDPEETARRVEAVRQGTAFKDWLAEEEMRFARHLLDPMNTLSGSAP